MATIAELTERINYLRQLNKPVRSQMARIRDVMNGGPDAVATLLGRRADLSPVDLPVVHLLDSGLARLAQRLRMRPDVKIDPAEGGRQRSAQTRRKRAEKRERIIEGYDRGSRLELDLAQASRWLPGYGFCVWVVRSRQGPGGHHYPHAELRDPFDCYPGWWGPNQKPDELAVARRVPDEVLERLYPAFANRDRRPNLSGPGMLLAGDGWESTGDGTVLVEYYSAEGTYVVIPQIGEIVGFVPNPLRSGPRFVIARRPTFDRLGGQYDHVIGLMAQMAKLNILALIATEDSVFRETNIIGEIESGNYQRGRFATNFFAPGTRIEKPSGDLAFGAFQQIDRLERQLRVGANYNVIDDALSPNSFVTGQGLDRLGQGTESNVAEYQLALRYALQDLDGLRLEWDEMMYAGDRKPVYAGDDDDAEGIETYIPSRDIDGNYLTRRVYGVMAGVDEPVKIVTFLQLLQARLVDHQTVQENLQGMENISKINERIDRRDAHDRLMEMLSAAAAQGDPKARMALVEIATDPADRDDILRKYFTPSEPQMSPDEQQFAAAQGASEMLGAGGGVPDVATVLSRLEGGVPDSGAEAGIQTVGRL
jgi:hypothetical protein